jgi:hypothetical protein
MEYRVILVGNGVYKKTLHRCRTRETAFINYHRIKEENNVLYPKKYLNTKGLKPVKYQICVTKPSEDTDTYRILRDDYGKLYTEEPIGDWTILESDEYLIEETFYIYGLDPKVERPNITEIIKRLVTGAFAKKMVKQIIVVHNKLVIYNEDQFDMVICKNLGEAQRLHHTLAKIAKKQKIKSLLFMGTAQPAQIGRLYDLIHEKTKWPYTKIRRTSTRP